MRAIISFYTISMMALGVCLARESWLPSTGSDDSVTAFEMVDTSATAETELTQTQSKSNWVDCVYEAYEDHKYGEDKSLKEKEFKKCVAKFGWKDKVITHSKAAGHIHKMIHSLSHKQKNPPPPKKISPGPTSHASHTAEKAQKLSEKAEKLAIANSEKKTKADEKLIKAKANERLLKAHGPGDKWELWYKEKVRKVNRKLRADKKAIRASRDNDIATAKAKARAAGAHVSDIGSY